MAHLISAGYPDTTLATLVRTKTDNRFTEQRGSNLNVVGNVRVWGGVGGGET